MSALVPAPGSGRPRRAGPAGGIVTAAAVLLALTLVACGGPAASPSMGTPTPSGMDGAGPDWLTPAAGGDLASCATPAPSGPVPVCAGPSDAPPGDAPMPGSSAQGASAAAGGGSLLASGGATVAASPTPTGIIATPTPAAVEGPGASTAPSATPESSSAPGPTPPAAGAAGAAPTSAAGFKVRATVVPMGFPLRATAGYRYGDGWRAPRVGIARWYNQIRGVVPDGSYLRAHDGLDLLVKLGSPVLAPFSGTVVDPAARWRPWDPSRYG
jgi:murein DD-endopeptidase MepM/ murein hydrolase activator NlpD